MKSVINVSVSPRVVLAVLLSTVACLCVLNVAVMFVHYHISSLHFLLRDLFDLNEEQSFGTWFSSILLLGIGALLFAVSAYSSDARSNQLYWCILGVGFCILSLDEVVGLHETLNTAVEFSWTLPGLVVAAVAGLIFAPFVFSLPSRTRALFILAGLLYVGGALGLERVGESFGQRDMFDTFEYSLLTVCEEAMEMFGATAMMYAVLDHISDKRTAKVAALAQPA